MAEHVPENRFGARSTASEALAGLELAGRTILVSGCNSGIGFETMRALSAHGAHVIGFARSAGAAKVACSRVGANATPIACDLSDLGSVAGAATAVRALGRPLDAIVANAGVMAVPRVDLLYGVERQFLVNHVAHAVLISRLADLVPDQTGRIVVVSSNASVRFAPRDGIQFDNLDGRRGYRPLRFYGQSKLANALYARELADRVAPRGIAVNALHPGVILETRLARTMPQPMRFLIWMGRRFAKTVAQGAATQTLLAASPLVEGITGRFWSDCQLATGSPFIEDAAMRSRLWQVTEEIAARAGVPL